MVFDNTLPFKNDLEPFESFKEKPNFTLVNLTFPTSSVDFADYELTVDNARVFQDIFRLRPNHIEFMTINDQMYTTAWLDLSICFILYEDTLVF